MEKQQKVTPIKRHEALVSYSKEHHTGLLLSWKIRAGKRLKVEESRISAYILYAFQQELDQHFRDEEQYLCPLLPEEHEGIRQLLNEHGELRQLVEQMVSQPDNGELTTAFADKLEAHIRFEERIFFNYLQSNLSTQQLTELISKERHAQEGCDSGWKDLFWLN
ncbi:MAG: hemerythrin domain-containing protein [Chitinophagaceae bacterium]|nr:hemerythrin domain-containing protein [Chitinophagaceae bacterium]